MQELLLWDHYVNVDAVEVVLIKGFGEKVLGVHLINSNAELLDVFESDIQCHFIPVLETSLSLDFKKLSLIDLLDLTFRVTIFQVHVFTSQKPHFHGDFVELFSLEELFEWLRIHFLLTHQDLFQNFPEFL